MNEEKEKEKKISLEETDDTPSEVFPLHNYKMAQSILDCIYFTKMHVHN